MRRTQRSREHGMTLMEAIVATVILAAVVVAIQQGIATAWRGLASVEPARAAVAVARRQLALSSAPPIVAGEQSGSDGRYSWRVTVSPQPTGIRAPAPVEAYWVEASVSWRERPFAATKNLTLRTLALQRAGR